MKKLAALFICLMLVVLAGCDPQLVDWKISAELGNGLYALVPNTESEPHEWYCTLDLETEQILSVGLKYPAEYGAPAETECRVGGKEIKCIPTAGERDSGGVLFYELSAETFSLNGNKRIKITQKFQNKTVTIEFTPQKVKAAFDNEK